MGDRLTTGPVDATEVRGAATTTGPAPQTAAPAAPDPTAPPTTERANRAGALALVGAPASPKPVLDTPAALLSSAAVPGLRRVRDGWLVGKDGATLPATARLPEDWCGAAPASRTLRGPGIEPVLPNNGKTPHEDLILVNGIMEDPALSYSRAQMLANAADGARVIALHNESDGMLADVGQTLGDELRPERNAATRALGMILYRAVRQDRPLQLVGHSQGALVIAEAVRLVEQQLRQEGLSAAAARQKLGSLKIETHAGAAASYPDGPQYVHYVNMLDAVPNILGVGSVFHPINPLVHPGDGAAIWRLAEMHLPHVAPGVPEESRRGASKTLARAVDGSFHGPEIYFAARRPFAEARQGQGHPFWHMLRDLFLSLVWLPVNLVIELFQLLLQILTAPFHHAPPPADLIDPMGERLLA